MSFLKIFKSDTKSVPSTEPISLDLEACNESFVKEVPIDGNHENQVPPKVLLDLTGFQNWCSEFNDWCSEILEIILRFFCSCYSNCSCCPSNCNSGNPPHRENKDEEGNIKKALLYCFSICIAIVIIALFSAYGGRIDGKFSSVPIKVERTTQLGNTTLNMLNFTKFFPIQEYASNDLKEKFDELRYAFLEYGNTPTYKAFENATFIGKITQHAYCIPLPSFGIYCKDFSIPDGFVQITDAFIAQLLTYNLLTVDENGNLCLTQFSGAELQIHFNESIYKNSYRYKIIDTDYSSYILQNVIDLVNHLISLFRGKGGRFTTGPSPSPQPSYQQVLPQKENSPIVWNVLTYILTFWPKIQDGNLQIYININKIIENIKTFNQMNPSGFNATDFANATEYI